MADMKPGKPITLREHQLIMLDILTEFAAFCGAHGLTYFLDAGTLLGAVRHQGFIPWDNDMDVCMLREDYEKLLALAESQSGMLNDHLILEKPEDTIYCFCKIGDTQTRLIEFPDSYPEECYVYIDVFPKDGLLNLGLETRVTCKVSEILALFHWFNKHSIPYWSSKKTGVKKLVARLAAPLVKDQNRPYHMQRSWIKHYSKRHPLSECRYMNTLVNGEYHRIAPKKCFEESVTLDFEGRSFNAPAGYDEWLRVLYGDNYMTPPPKNRQTVHHVLASWRDGIGENI